MQTMKLAVCASVFLLSPIGSAWADEAKVYAKAPMDQYQMGSVAEEIALSRSAAPASISDNATVLTLGEHGYETTVHGNNGFVCLVERSWADPFADSEFWNPKIRAPNCFNAAAAQSVLRVYLKRTEWVMAGASKSDMIEREKAERAANHDRMPEPGAMCYMMSKLGYLGDSAGHWHPHLMFYTPKTDGSTWGAGQPGSPVFAGQAEEDQFTTFYVLVPAWSDVTAML
jgi:hypothetical protein